MARAHAADRSWPRSTPNAGARTQAVGCGRLVIGGFHPLSEHAHVGSLETCPPFPSLTCSERRRRQRALAFGRPTGRPRPEERRASRVDSIFLAEGMSIPRLAGLILLVEVVYVTALAFAVPRGSGAVALAFVTTFLLATVISHRVGRCQPASTNLKTRQPQRRAPSVTRPRRTYGRRAGSDAPDARGT